MGILMLSFSLLHSTHLEGKWKCFPYHLVFFPFRQKAKGTSLTCLPWAQTCDYFSRNANCCKFRTSKTETEKNKQTNNKALDGKLGFSSCGCDKLLWQRKLKGEMLCRAHNSRLESVLAGSSPRQELERTGPIASIVKNREQWSICPSQLHFIQLGEWRCPQGRVFPHQ